MKKGVLLLQLGLGRTGRALVGHYLAQADRYPQLRYLGIGDRSGLWIIPDGWGRPTLAEAAGFKTTGVPLTRWGPSQRGSEWVPAPEAYTPDLIWRLDELGIRRAIVVDTTGPGSNTAPLLVELRRAGYDVVLANKAPLAGSQESYQALTGPARGRLVWDAAVSAGLPVAAALARAARGGDPIVGLVAMPSAGLGLILAAIARGGRFSEAVQEAARQGLLHPDVREDLSGQDTARTALILARQLGHPVEPGAIRLQGLVPAGLDRLPPEILRAGLRDLDPFFAERAWVAGERHRVVRYLARIGPEGIGVGLDEIPLESSAGRLAGGETLFTFYTEHGGEHPTTLLGPGPRPGTAATAVFADIASLL